MKPHQQLRRQAAVEARILSKTAGRLTVMDPEFNLREMAKQLILVEDHLFHPSKHCPDCIRKHLLFTEALAEETTTLDTQGVWAALVEGIAETCKSWIEKLADGAEPLEVAQEIRKVRKELVKLCYDPRKAHEARVAALHTEKTFEPFCTCG